MQDEILEMDESPSTQSEACASRKCERSRKPSPTGERAMRSSRRASATAASEIGLSRYLEQIRWHEGFLFPVIHDSLPL